MHALLAKLAQSVVTTYRPIPCCETPPFNLCVQGWSTGMPIPEGTLCMRLLTWEEMETCWDLQEAGASKAVVPTILASICDNKGTPLFLSPERPLDYPAEAVKELNSVISPALGMHIFDCIREYSGWGKFGKLEEDPVEADAKNS